MKRNQKGLSSIMAVIIIGLVVIVIAFFFWTQKRGSPTETQQITQNVPIIQDSSGLNTAASDLDNLDLNAVDKELNQLDLETSVF